MQATVGVHNSIEKSGKFFWTDFSDFYETEATRVGTMQSLTWHLFGTQYGFCVANFGPRGDGPPKIGSLVSALNSVRCTTATKCLLCVFIGVGDSSFGRFRFISSQCTLSLHARVFTKFPCHFQRARKKQKKCLSAFVQWRYEENVHFVVFETKSVQGNEKIEW